METTNNIVSVITGGLGIAMIQDVLGVIILVLSIANILINLGFKIYDKIKKKKYKEITKDIDDTITTLEELEDKTDD